MAGIESSDAEPVKRRRGLIIRGTFNDGNESEEIDPAVIAADHERDAALTGCDLRYLAFDRMAIEDPMYCHQRFLDTVRDQRPDFVFYHPTISSYLIHRNLRPEFLFLARKLYGARIVCSFGDVAYPYFAAYCAGYAAFADVAVTWDGQGAGLAALAPQAVVLDLWTPSDERQFRDHGVERDIDVSFIGQINRYQDRVDGLAALQALGIPVFTAGGELGKYLDLAEYARLIARSRISLNFSQTKEAAGIHQLKGRVFESILCGALLLESENDVTPRYLTPYRHYVPFGSATDLADKIRHYLGDEAARRTITDAAKAHVEATMTARIWWQRILDALGPERSPRV